MKSHTYYGLILKIKETGEVYKGVPLYRSQAQAERLGRWHIEKLYPHLEVQGVFHFEDPIQGAGPAPEPNDPFAGDA